MSLFTYNRDNTTNKIDIKTLSLSINPKINNNKTTLSNNNGNLNLSVLSLSGISVTSSGTQLNYVNSVINGIGSANKALITNTTNDISSINSLSCNQLIVNGNNIIISGNNNNLGASESNSPYLQKIKIGQVQNSKALVLDTNKNIETINTLSSNEIILSNNNKIINTHSKSINKKKIHPIVLTSINTTFANNLSNICWSPELSLAVAIANSGTNRLITSTDGINWTPRTIPADNDWSSICWSSELNLFIVIGQSGSNRIMYSSNGINWNLATDSLYPTKLSLSSSNSYIILNNGAFLACGSNENGRLANGNSNSQSTLNLVTNINNLLDIKSGSDFTLFLFNDNTVKSWGTNTYGQLGNGNNTNQTSLTAINLSNVIKISASKDYYCSLALLSNGTIKSWGFNPHGQLGTNSTTSSNIPVDVLNITNAIEISAGYTHCLALLSDGTIKGWGTNDFGQLGDNSTTRRYTPVTVSGINNAIAISAGTDYSMALLSDGTIKTWGINTYGQLGNNSTTNSLIPVNVSGINNAISISAGSNFSIALLNNNTVKVWGRNNYGQLGEDTTTTQRLIPNTISGLNNVIYIETGTVHTYVLLSDKTIYRFGYGSSGQLATASTNITIPTLMPDSWSINNSSWSSICWSPQLNLFTAVANNGNSRVMISNNGIDWTPQKASVNNNWTSICWSPELSLFVAVSSTGTGNRVMTSPDSINWTARTSASDNNWTSVVWVPRVKLFMAVSNTGVYYRVMTSANGTSWTIINSPYDSNWISICDCPQLNMTIAVANSGTDRIMYTYNGIEWFVGTSNPQFPINNIIWANSLNKFLITCDNTYTYSNITYSNTNLMTTSNWYTLFTYSKLNNSTYSVVQSGSNPDVQLQINSTATTSSLTSLWYNQRIQDATTFTINFEIKLSGTADATSFNIGYTSNSFLGDGPNKSSFCLVFHLFTGLRPRGLYLFDNNGIEINYYSYNLNENTWRNVQIIYTNSTTNTWQFYFNNINIFNYSNYNQSSWLTNSGSYFGFGSRTGGETHDCTIRKFTLSGNLINTQTTNFINSKILNSQIFTNSLELSNYGRNYNILNNGDAFTVHKIIGDTAKSQRYTFIPSQIIWINELNIYIMGNTTNNSIAYSSDGFDWIVTTTITGFFIKSLCWSSQLKLIVAVSSTGTSNNVITSPDGITWTLRTNVPTNIVLGWYGVCWSSSLNLFVAVGYGNASLTHRVMTSSDGITWTLRKAGVYNCNWSAICWSPELNIFVAISNSGFMSTMYSYNGIDWYPPSNFIYGTGSNLAFTSICWSPELNLFAAVSADRIIISSDGINWAYRTVNNYSWKSICWAPGLEAFIAVTNTISNNLMYSMDGLTWYYKSLAIYATVSDIDLNAICWSDTLNIFTAVGSAKVLNYPMTNQKYGFNSFSNSNNLSYFNNYDNVYNDNIYNTWYNTSNNVSNEWTSICYSSDLNLLVAVSKTGSNNRIITSSDGGYNWISRTNPVDNNWTSICYSTELNLFVAVSNSGTSNRIMTSSDGINWNIQINPVDNDWTSICYSSDLNLFVSVSNSGTNNRVMTSSDGINWISRVSAVDNNWTSICWASNLNLFVAVSNSGTNNRVMTSSNGINWTSQVSAVNNNWTSVCWSNKLNLLIAVADSGTNNRIMISPDGINWSISNIIYKSVSSNKNISMNSIFASTNYSLAICGESTIVKGWGWDSSSYSTGLGNLPITQNGLTNVKKIVGSQKVIKILLNNGTVQTRGFNQLGEIGTIALNTGALFYKTPPYTVQNINTGIDIATGNNFTLVLLSDGTIKSWGSNENGQLGNNSTTASFTPITVNNISTAINISAHPDSYHSLALLDDGTIMSWGLNTNGQLGDNSTTQRLTPVTVSNINNAIAISVGDSHSLALLSDGTIKSWGLNTSGQLGNNSTTQSIIPVIVSGITNAIAISTGKEFSLALLSNGTIMVWGKNNLGQLGIGNNVNQLVPILISNLSNIIGISAGSNHVLALVNNGTLKSWGYNDRGQLGNNTTTNSNIPIDVRNSTNTGDILTNIKIDKLINTNYVNNNWVSICWSDEMNVFVAISNTGTLNRIMVSNDGYTWYPKNSLIDNNWTSICWADLISKFIIISSDNNILYSNVGKPNLLAAVTTLGANQIGNNLTTRMYINGVNGNSDLNINEDSNRKLLRLSYNDSSTNSVDFTSSSNPNYQINIVNNSNNKITNIVNHNGSTYGLTFNGSLLLVNATDLNKLQLSTFGQAEASKALIVDNNLNINNINNITLNKLVVNNKRIFNSDDNNSEYFNNVTPGIVSANKPLIVDNNKNIELLNKIDSKSLYLNKFNNIKAIINKGTFDSTAYYINNFQPVKNKYPNNLNYNQIIWVSDLNLFIGTGGLYNYSAYSYTATSYGINISIDGINWKNAQSLQYAGNDYSLNLAYSPSLKIIVGYTFWKLYYSYDGYTWYNKGYQTSSNPLSFTSVCWANSLNLFVAVTGTTNVMTSSDGLNWTYRTPANGNNWTSICWSPDLSLLVAVSSTGTGNRVMTSPDSINWTARTSAVDNNWTSICWSSELSLFVVVSNTGTNNRVMTSSDGISWTSRTSAANNNWNSVIWSSNLSLFIAVANTNGSNNSIMKSSNGTSWTTIATTNIDAGYKTITYSPELNLLVAGSFGSNPAYFYNKVITSSNGGDTWTLQDTSYDIWWHDMVYISELSLFITISNSGNNYAKQYAISADGIDWTLRKINSSVASNFRSLAWSSSLSLLIVCYGVGSGTTFYKTSDCINWTSVTVPSGTWMNVKWISELSMFIAVSSGGTNRMIKSTDGINWSVMTSFTFTQALYNIEYASSLNMLIAVGTGNPAIYFTSTDNGNSWIQRSLTVNGSNISLSGESTIAWISQVSKFYYYQTNTSTIYISSDGINWISITTTWKRKTTGWNMSQSFPPLTTGKPIWVPQLNKLYVITTGVGTTLIESSDGINWEYNKYRLSNLSIYHNLCWAESIKTLIGFGYTSSYAAGTPFLILNQFLNPSYNYNLESINSLNNFSNNQINNSINTWISRTSAVDNDWTSICFSRELNLFVAVSNTGTNNRVMTSLDSITWTSRTSAANNNWTSICYSPELNLFVAVSNSGTSNRVMTSSDGITWTIQTSAADNDWTSVCWANDLRMFVAVSNSGTNNRVMTSSNGINWEIRTSAADNNWTSICWSNELTLLVAVSNSGTNNRIMTSSDGITWTIRNNIVDNDWTSICWSPELNLFAAVSNTGTNDRVITSSNGINWISQTSAIDNNWISICWANRIDQFVAISNTGTNNRVMTSSDGINWTLQTTPINNNWTSICWSMAYNLLVCVSNTGINNRVLTSTLNTPYNMHNYPCSSNTLYINQTNGNVGLGTLNPNYQLELSTDSAAKPSTAYWTISSDARLKENIEDADLDICYNNIKKLRLVEYTWKDDVYPNENVTPIYNTDPINTDPINTDLDNTDPINSDPDNTDPVNTDPINTDPINSEPINSEQVNSEPINRTQLGWIADEVEQYLPKSIKKIKAHNLDDCKTLDSDQIIASMYGTVKKLINEDDIINNKILLLKNNIKELEIYIDELKTILN